MKKIYIILAHTGTVPAKIIKYYTKDEFSHVSISLDENLEEMYSFARLNPYNPFVGGFVKENINKGIFKRFKNTRTKVYSLIVTDTQYDKVRRTIEYFKNNQQKYKYDIMGVIFAGINKRIVRKNTFHCAEFVKHILKVAGVTGVNELPEIIRPENFKQLQGLRLEYEGLLKKYKKKKDLTLRDVQSLVQKNNIGYV